MPTPSKHALCSSSSAHRWLNCTAAPRFELNFPSSTSSFAEEGTLAHEFCELYARYKFGQLDKKKFNNALKKLQDKPYYADEMLHCAEFYADHLMEKANGYSVMPYTASEVHVDFSVFVPDGFGTCDNVMIGDDIIDITDYKHGKGVPVSPVENPQMKLYAIGAVEKYKAMYGDTIKRVRMTIVQPRITEDVHPYETTVEALYEWGRKIVQPAAQAAFTGNGAQFNPGDWCRFCRGKAQCRARAEQNIALAEFKDCVPVGQIPAGECADPAGRKMLGLPPILSDDEIGNLLTVGENLIHWYGSIKDYALDRLMQGHPIKGYKCVAGRSVRSFADTDTAIKTLLDSGIDRALIYDYKPKSLSELEKVIGKKRFGELLEDQIVRPMGAPALAKESDKRPVYSSAEADFAGVKHED